MTWGKAIPYWTESLDKSLHIAQKLNDKYALDGRDPSSIVEFNGATDCLTDHLNRQFQ